MERMSWNVTFIVMRYLAIVGLLMYQFIAIGEIDTSVLMVFLIYVINNQIRFFTLQKKPAIMVSLFLDLVLIYLLYLPGYMFYCIYFIISCFDTILLKERKQMSMMNILFLAEMIILYRREAPAYIVVNAVILVILLLFLQQISVENERVSEAQYLYDELRSKENELKELNDELERYAGTVESLTVLRERNRISRELHDNIGHRLSATVIQLSAIEKLIDRDTEKAKEMVSYLREYQSESLQSVREVINELKPKTFENYEGIITIEQLIKNFRKLSGISVRMNILNKEQIWKLNEVQVFALYRIVQESLSNALRHGKASQVDINFNYMDTQLIMTIRDNGIGQDKITEGNGLTIMRQRLRELGGSVKYETSANQGFLIVIKLPRQEQV